MSNSWSLAPPTVWCHHGKGTTMAMVMVRTSLNLFSRPRRAWCAARPTWRHLLKVFKDNMFEVLRSTQALKTNSHDRQKPKKCEYDSSEKCAVRTKTMTYMNHSQLVSGLKRDMFSADDFFYNCLKAKRLRSKS